MQRVLMGFGGSKQVAPGYGLPNDCRLLFSIDLAAFCDIPTQRMPHLKPLLIVQQGC